MSIQERAKKISDLYRRGFLEKALPELEKLTPLEAAYVVAAVAADLDEGGYLHPANLAEDLLEVVKEKS